jgi:hypothetical protein
MGGADTITVRDGGKSLDMNTDETADCVRLGFTQLRELLGHVLHRAVMLTQLYAEAALVRRRGEAVLRQRLGQCSRTVLEWQVRDASGVLVLELSNPAPSERLDRFLAGRLRDEAESVDGNVVVGQRPSGVAGVGEREHLGRAAPGASAVDPLLASGDRAVLEHGVEVSAHARRGQPELLGERGRGLRSTLEQERGDPLAGASVQKGAGRTLFHNAIVP